MPEEQRGRSRSRSRDRGVSLEPTVIFDIFENDFETVHETFTDVALAIASLHTFLDRERRRIDILESDLRILDTDVIREIRLLKRSVLLLTARLFDERILSRVTYLEIRRNLLGQDNEPPPRSDRAGTNIATHL